MGMTLREIIYDIGGGATQGKLLRQSRPRPLGSCLLLASST